MGRVEQKMSEQVSKLQQQLQKVREQGREEMASLEREMAKQVAEERDKSEHLRESLLATKKVCNCLFPLGCMSTSPSNHYGDYTIVSI